MSTTIFIPFNGDPSTTGQVTSYTVPSGKYAKVTVHLQASAITKPTYNVTAGSITTWAHRALECGNQSLSDVYTIILAEGDVLTGTTSAASATHSASPATGNYVHFDTGFQTSTTTITINGNTVAQLVAKSFLYMNVDVSAAGATLDYATTTGTSFFKISYDEYNKIT